MFKNLLKKLLDTLGVEIHKKRTNSAENKNDLKLYNELYKRDSIDNKRFYNVGSGSFSHPYWTNLDYVSDWYVGMQINVIHIDLMEKGPLPIEANSAEVIYSSHTIEHVKDDAVQNLFNESYKVLKPGGFIRITTGPDADTDFEALQRGDIGFTGINGMKPPVLMNMYTISPLLPSPWRSDGFIMLLLNWHPMISRLHR